jgi:hypothetical protein
MTPIPTLAQLLQQAIDNRLLDVHTALIARVESYDAETQQINVSPVLKRQVKTLDGTWVSEQLPVLCNVPVLFPRAGGFFISFPIQTGDFVQLIFNEVSIDGWVTDEASAVSQEQRFTLQGAVAIPGIFPPSQALAGAHKTNLVLGQDEGLQIHIDGQKIRLGSADAHEALAIAKNVKEELEKIRTAINYHTHPSNGAPPKMGLVPSTLVSKIGDISTQHVVAL